MTTTPLYYDEAMTGRGEPAMLPLAESPWRPMYEQAARWIPSGHPVVDLGCGTGRFLAALAETSHYGEMVGVDFSEAAVAEARAYVPSAVFVRGDLREWQPDSDRPGNTTYVCLEVLEHLEDDRELVSRIPPGHQAIISVPNYESAAHLRVFRSAQDAVNRYGRWLDFGGWRLAKLDERKAIHLFDTVRKVDSW